MTSSSLENGIQDGVQSEEGQPIPFLISCDDVIRIFGAELPSSGIFLWHLFPVKLSIEIDIIDRIQKRRERI